MKQIERLTVKYRDRIVGTLSLTPDNRLCAFEYDSAWLAEGFSISPLEMPLQKGLFIAKPQPFSGGFGIFEDSLPDGYGRYLLHKTLQREGINDAALSSLDRLSIVGAGGMGALTYHPENRICSSTDETCCFIRFPEGDSEYAWPEWPIWPEQNRVADFFSGLFCLFNIDVLCGKTVCYIRSSVCYNVYTANE